MPDVKTIAAVVLVSDLLMPLLLIHMWVALRSASSGQHSWRLSIPLLAALAWGALWAWYPPMSALRLQPPPFGQAGAILTVVLASVAFFSLPPVRRSLIALNPRPLLTFGTWRIVYGAILLVLGLQGALPAAFFWSAAFGDIAVGLWAILILSRQTEASRQELIAWNAVGLVDLVHVLALGAINFGAFYAANPQMPLLNLLPLTGVPLFIAIHIITLRRLFTRNNLTLPQTAAA
jgi:hypothetical protein